MGSYYNTSKYQWFNLTDNVSDIKILIKEYKDRVKQQLDREEEIVKTPFISFATKRPSVTDLWIKDNEDKFFTDTENEILVKLDYLSVCGAITCMTYSSSGEFIIVGHSSGLIQVCNMDDENAILAEYAANIEFYYRNEQRPNIWYPMYFHGKLEDENRYAWLKDNYNTFLRGTKNDIIYYRWFFTESGYITALEYSPCGSHVIVGHSSGLIQMRHGRTGIVLCTLRTVQFPPKPIYALEYSNVEERVCYAGCMDGVVYRIELPNISFAVDDPSVYCIRADPALESLNLQFYGSPGISSYATSFISQRSPALSLGLSSDQTKMMVGYADTSIKVYDMETQEAELTYKVHKLRLQFIPKKLQRMHFGQVCALRCHRQRPYMFASAAWDKTLRIWDIRCKVGCVMTFEGVDVCSDSIDLNRDLCVAGSWQPTEALTLWDLAARKKHHIVRVQNRRLDVDGEYIYACRFWNSSVHNRKGKYGIIGGSGTKCVEVINLHNRYITCSYPAPGTVLAVTSHQEYIAFGGTAPVFTIVKFHDPKHEKDKYESESELEYDNTKDEITTYEDENNSTAPINIP